MNNKYGLSDSSEYQVRKLTCHDGVYCLLHNGTPLRVNGNMLLTDVVGMIDSFKNDNYKHETSLFTTLPFDTKLVLEFNTVQELKHYFVEYLV